MLFHNAQMNAHWFPRPALCFGPEKHSGGVGTGQKHMIVNIIIKWLGFEIMIKKHISQFLKFSTLLCHNILKINLSK